MLKVEVVESLRWREMHHSLHQYCLHCFCSAYPIYIQSYQTKNINQSSVLFVIGKVLWDEPLKHGVELGINRQSFESPKIEISPTPLKVQLRTIKPHL